MGVSRTYNFLSCLRTILKLHCQSRKLSPVNLSFLRIDAATAVEVEKILVGMMGRLIVRCFVAEATCGPMETLIGAQAATFIADLATDNSPLKREYEMMLISILPPS
ncbi:hypothetical protein Tco_0169384 [Tanacetum coccineum]